MSESRIPPKPGGPASQLDYFEVIIGGVKGWTTKESAERFIKQMAKQPAYQQQFYNAVEFEPEQVVGLDNV